MSEVLIDIKVDKHANMLIIGKGATDYSLKQISYETDYDEVLQRYGESDISKAFQIAYNMGVEYIFVMNLKNSYDYFDVAEVIKQNDFTYIVPVSVYLSDTFTDSFKDGSKVSYVAYLLSLVSSIHNESVIIATDKHASLYEDMDAFIEGQAGAESIFRRSCGGGMNMENIIFIANNSVSNEFANVMLAAALCTSDIGAYPSNAFGEAIFDFDHFDDVGNWAYFKSHIEKETTVENLINFLQRGPEKIVTVSRILKMIKREIDLSEFVGHSYSEYQRMRIERRLELYLGGLINYVIYNYKINSVKGYRDPDHRGCVTIINRFDVWPINCLDRCHVEIGVEV